MLLKGAILHLLGLVELVVPSFEENIKIIFRAIQQFKNMFK